MTAGTGTGAPGGAPGCKPEEPDIVPANRMHADVLAALHAAAVRPGEPCWQPMAFDALLASGTVAGSISMRQSEPTGFVLWRVAADEGEILLLAVHPAHRRRGVATALLRQAVAAAGDDGAESMWLEVAVDNPAPIALYKREGFVEMARRPGYYHRTAGPRADALVFRRLMSTDGEILTN